MNTSDISSRQELRFVPFFSTFHKAVKHYEKAKNLGCGFNLRTSKRIKRQLILGFIEALIVAKDIKKADKIIQKELDGEYKSDELMIYQIARTFAIYEIDFKRARKWYEKALELKPLHPKTLGNLALLLGLFSFAENSLLSHDFSKFEEGSRNFPGIN